MIGNASKRTPCERRQSACLVAGDEQHDEKNCTFVYDFSEVVNASCPRHPRHLPLDHGVRRRDVRATVPRDLLAKHGRGNCGVESAAIFFVAEVKP